MKGFLAPCLVVALLVASSAAFAGPPSRWGESSGTKPSATTKAEDAGTALVPVQTPAGTVLAPAPAHAAPRAIEPGLRPAAPPSLSVPPPPPPSRAPTSGTSDLPSGWEPPPQLPPGAVRLEEVEGRSIAPAAPAAPAAPVAPSPITESDVSGEGWIQETPKKPPSRWGN